MNAMISTQGKFASWFLPIGTPDAEYAEHMLELLNAAAVPPKEYKLPDKYRFEPAKRVCKYVEGVRMLLECCPTYLAGSLESHLEEKHGASWAGMPLVDSYALRAAVWQSTCDYARPHFLALMIRDPDICAERDGI